MNNKTESHTDYLNFLYRRKSISLFGFLILMFGFSGCTSSITATPISTVVNIVRITPTIAFTKTPTKTPSLTLAPSELPPLTSTPSPTPQIPEFICPSLSTELPVDSSLSGLLVLQAESGAGNNPYLLDISTNEILNLPDSDNFSIDQLRISPNREWVAYFAYSEPPVVSKPDLIVANTNGEILYKKTDNSEDFWYVIATWINNETIMLERKIFDADRGIIINPHPVSILNPFTQEITGLSSDFPNLLPFFEPFRSWDVFGKSGTAYDPTMKFVAYGSLNPENQVQQIVLWDQTANQEITRLQAAADYGNGPVWSSDGSVFITDSLVRELDEPRGPNDPPIPEELFSVSPTGKITHLTYFSDHATTVLIGGYVWSPNNTQVAFWVTPLPAFREFGLSGLSDVLAIINLEDLRVTVYCIEGVEYLEPHWSPDGRHLLVNGVDHEKSSDSGSRIYNVLLLDPIENRIYKIADDATILGWMVDP